MKCRSVISLFVIVFVAIFQPPAYGQPDDKTAPTISIDPIPLSTMELVWHDLFGGTFDSNENAIYLRTDLTANSGGYEVVVANIFGETSDQVEVQTGAYFVESSRFQVYNFSGDMEFFTTMALVIVLNLN